MYICITKDLILIKGSNKRERKREREREREREGEREWGDAIVWGNT